jgi:hypothetical protein
LAAAGVAAAAGLSGVQLQAEQQQMMQQQQQACRACLSAQHGLGFAKRCPLHTLLLQSAPGSSVDKQQAAEQAAVAGVEDGDEAAGDWVSALGFDGVQLVGALHGMADEVLGGEVQRIEKGAQLRAASAARKRRQQQQQQQESQQQEGQQQVDAADEAAVQAAAADGVDAGVAAADAAAEAATLGGAVNGAGIEAGSGGSSRRTRQRRSSAAEAALEAAGLEPDAAVGAAATGAVSGRFGIDPWSFVAAAVLLQEVGRAVLQGHGM